MSAAHGSFSTSASADRPRLATAATSDAAARAAGVLFFFAAAAFLTGIMLAASIAPGYDDHGAAISDLGVIAGTAFLFNTLLVVVGLLNLVGGYLFFRSHGRVGLLAVFVIAAVGAAGAGLMPLSTGAPHSILALVGFVFFNLEAIGGAAVLGGPVRAIGVLAGAIGLVFVVLMVIGDAGDGAVFGAIGHGGTERMIVYPAMLWLLALGGDLMARHGDGRADDAG